MAQPNDLIGAEASYIGISGTDNIFNTWIWGQHVYDSNVYPWCAAFQSYCLSQIGVDFTPTASAAGVLNQFPRVDDDDVQQGDIVCFNWDGRSDTGWMDHVGMIEWFDHSSGYFGTIEGNTGGGEGCVMRCTRYNYGSYFTAFSRPSWVEAPYIPPVRTPEQAAGPVYNDNGLIYCSHVANLGWANPVRDGQISGTEGYSAAVECIKITSPLKLSVKVHEQGVGDVDYGDISKNPEMGTTGESRRLEAINITLLEKDCDSRQIHVQAHVQDIGWQNEVGSGNWAGSRGESKRLEAFRMWFTPNGIQLPGKADNDKGVKYRAHVQDLGWCSWVHDGQVAGTVGFSLRMEAIQIDCPDIHTVKAHIENVGWVTYENVTKDTVIGTIGEGKRIEALIIDGDVEWCCQVQDIGWQSYIPGDGYSEGSTGMAKRIEAIKIRKK